MAVALTTALGLVMLLVPGDQAFTVGVCAGAMLASIICLRASPPVGIASWEQGAYGEEATAKVLRGLEREGWTVLHDLANGSVNFDHVVLGPGGVYCLNSKWSSYRLELTAEGGLVGRHAYDDALTLNVSTIVRRARAEAAALSAQISERCGRRVWVDPVVVWWGDVEQGGRTVDGVGVVQGKLLADRLRAQRRRPVRDLEEIAEVLRPGRHARASGAPVQQSGGSPATCGRCS
ncbi:nuclease-related domain-containing protein [Cellulomonas endophytica]|uniref:nuclease-related domain-containing protein n=1 Tax=Cellulomonas endophytica TaxID=2494735 RepID=UPI0013E99A2E|nr:nuclease-related domain-containing protein [Cellulomonas endophytica]